MTNASTTHREHASAWRVITPPPDAVVDCVCLLIELWVSSTNIAFAEGALRITLANQATTEQEQRMSDYLALVECVVPWHVPVLGIDRKRSVVSFVAMGLA